MIFRYGSSWYLGKTGIYRCKGKDEHYRKTNTKKKFCVHGCMPKNYFLPVTLITWKPNWVLTGPAIVPGSFSNATFSNSGTICPLPNHPRSPPFFREGQDENRFATAAKSSPSLILFIILFASSSVLTR